jgi:predicted nuclease of predicted toxin-antitoxin system
VRGHPPKVICIRAGNCSTERIADLLVAHAEQLEAFLVDSGESVLFI